MVTLHVREEAVVMVAKAIHNCTSHPEYPSYEEAGCSGTPGPALINPTIFHKDTDMEEGLRGICWGCEPLAATAVDELIKAGLIK